MPITKSDFLVYLDAPCHLWAVTHDQIPEKERNAYIEHLSDQGYEVEAWAGKYVQEVLVPQYGAHPEDILMQTTVTSDSFETRVDILIKQHGGTSWDMYEVKSSTETKKKHLYDAAFQTLVVRDKYTINNVFVLHLNRDYIRHGAVDIKQLFVADNITNKVVSLEEEVKLLREGTLKAAEAPEFDGILGCSKPRECLCPNLCHPNLPEYSIFDVNRLTQSKKKIQELLSNGIRSVYDIPTTFPLSATQRFQVKIAQSGQASIDTQRISADLEGLHYPICFIDYETFNPAVPLYDGYRAYDHVPFQYSLHVLREPEGNVEHHEFLHTEQTDPVPLFLASLHNHLADHGSIVVWNKAFEGNVNKRMAELCPRDSDYCTQMNSRYYDLMVVFQNQWYAHPNFKGSYSIKKVLPVLVPELSYKEMEIGEGATAMATWKRLVFEQDLEEVEKKQLIEAMLKYCEMDTYAMLRIWQELLAQCNTIVDKIELR